MILNQPSPRTAASLLVGTGSSRRAALVVARAHRAQDEGSRADDDARARSSDEGVITREQFDRIAQEFDFLRCADAASIAEFRRAATLARFPARKRLFCEGEHPQTLALLVSGAVRVFKTGRTGREITLYRIGAGETCILSVNAILTRQPIAAAATVDERAEAATIPAEVLRDWVQRHEVWRQFVFGLISQRLMKVLSLVEDVVFRRMDARVATLLLERGRAQNPLRITHQEIAAELGTSREVIGRFLEDLAGTGTVRSTRGRIEILDRQPLEVLASQ
jgi:CRP/FNR family transcriptional regulator